MNRTLLEQWRAGAFGRATRSSASAMSVMPARAWADEDLAVELAACPGKRLLVIGNHDVDDFEQIGRGGFGPQYAAAVCDTNPVLVLTHVPLRRIPPTAVNGARPPARPAGYHRPPITWP